MTDEEYHSSAAKALWTVWPVGGQRSTAEVGSEKYFDEIKAYRYGYETPFIPRVLASLEPEGKRVLELGVGQGTDASELCRLGASYTGVDVTQRHLDLTAQHLSLRGHTDFTLRTGEIAAMQFDRPFDIVYSFGVLHHIEHEDACLRSLRAVCKPSGTALFALYARASVLNAYMLLTWLLRDRMRHTVGAWRSHLSELSPIDEPVVMRVRGRREIAKLLASTGWRIESHRRYGFVPGYLPLVGRWIDPSSPLLDATARLLGWYHVFRCTPLTA
jgi:SAM-dependent methyltransferase